MLSKIASAIGTPLFTDRRTATKESLTFARVCVEVEVDNPLLKSIQLDGPEGRSMNRWLSMKGYTKMQPLFCVWAYRSLL